MFHDSRETDNQVTAPAPERRDNRSGILILFAVNFGWSAPPSISWGGEHTGALGAGPGRLRRFHLSRTNSSRTLRV
jgi:hypothetical protein